MLLSLYQLSKAACIHLELWEVLNLLCIRISHLIQKRKHLIRVFLFTYNLCVEGTILDALGLGHLKRPPISKYQSKGEGGPSQVNVGRRQSIASEGSEESPLSQESRFAQEKRKQKEPDEEIASPPEERHDNIDIPQQPTVAARKETNYTPRENISEASGSVVDATPAKKKLKCLIVT
jgi:hypothetical protein